MGVYRVMHFQKVNIDSTKTVNTPVYNPRNAARLGYINKWIIYFFKSEFVIDKIMNDVADIYRFVQEIRFIGSHLRKTCVKRPETGK